MGDAAATAAAADLRAECSRVFSRGALTSATLAHSGLRGQIHYKGADPELSAAGHTRPALRRARRRLLAGKGCVPQTPAPRFDRGNNKRFFSAFSRKIASVSGGGRSPHAQAARFVRRTASPMFR